MFHFVINVASSLFWAGLLLVLWKFGYLTYVLIRVYVLPNFGILTVDLKKYGEWAVVTGASDGIGKGYVEELAKRGLNIVLISRSHDKTTAVAREVERLYKVKVKVIVYDFSTVDAKNEDALKEELNGLDIGILVNNVGMSVVDHKLCEDYNVQKEVYPVCYVNIFSALLLTNIILKSMVLKERGIIIHISSIYGYISPGYPMVYPATKAFMSSYVKSLQEEVAMLPNVHHQLVTPSFVYTNMTDKVVNNADILVPYASTYAASAVRTIGLTDNAFGYWVHEIIGQLFLLSLPTWILQFTILYTVAKKQLKQMRADSKNKQD